MIRIWMCVYDQDLNVCVWSVFECVCMIRIWMCVYDQDLNVCVWSGFECVCMIRIWMCVYDQDLNVCMIRTWNFCTCVMRIWMYVHAQHFSVHEAIYIGDTRTQIKGGPRKAFDHAVWAGFTALKTSKRGKRHGKRGKRHGKMPWWTTFSIWSWVHANAI